MNENTLECYDCGLVIPWSKQALPEGWVRHDNIHYCPGCRQDEYPWEDEE